MSLLSSIGRVRCLADEENDHNMLQGKFHSLYVYIARTRRREKEKEGDLSVGAAGRRRFIRENWFASLLLPSLSLSLPEQKTLAALQLVNLRSRV